MEWFYVPGMYLLQPKGRGCSVLSGGRLEEPDDPLRRVVRFLEAGLERRLHFGLFRCRLIRGGCGSRLGSRGLRLNSRFLFRLLC